MKTNRSAVQAEQGNVDPESTLRVRGRILSEAGSGLDGANIGWARVRGPGSESFQVIDARALPFKVSERRSATTQSDGTFDLEIPDLSRAGGSDWHEVVWCARAGYAVSFLDRAGSLSEDWQVGDWVQEARESTLVVVSAEGSARLPGIEVSQRGMAQWGGEADDYPMGSVYVGLYEFSAVTDGNGITQIPFLAGASTILARKPSGTAREWRGADPHRVDIEFGASVTLGGSVALGPGAAFTPGVEVLVETVEDERPRNSQVVKVSDSLEWGPIEVGLPKGAKLLVQARGPGLYGPRVESSPKGAGAQLGLVLELNKANDLWAFACDENWEPVAKAVVSVEWRDRFGVQTKRIRPQTSGHAMFSGVPDGQVTLRSVAKDYCEASVTVHLPEDEISTYPLPMESGELIEGVCTQGGKPCEFFEVLAWPSGFPEKAVRRTFCSQEGRFQIRGVAQGELVVMAAGRNGSLSGNVLVVAGTDAARKLSLALGTSFLVRGQLVSGDDALLADAFVQYRSRGIAVGSRAWIDVEGKFSIKIGSMDAAAEIQAQASGYSSKVIPIPPGKGSMDLGQILLQRTIPLELTILTNPGQAQEEILIECPQCGLPEISPNASGLARYPGVDLGTHEIEVHVADATTTILEVDVGKENPARATLDLRGEASVLVYLENIPEEYNTGLALFLTRSHDATGPGIAFGARTGGANEFGFTNLKGGNYRAEACSLDGLSLGYSSFTLADGEAGHATVTITKERVRLKILDSNGKPIPGVHALFHRGNGQSLGNCLSDEAGTIRIIPIGTELVYLCLTKEGIGHHWNIPLSLPNGPQEETIEVTMLCNASMNLKLVDAEGPIARQRCKATGIGFSADVSNPGETDSEGLVSFTNLSSGPFLLQVSVPGHWPYNREYDATTTGEVQIVEIPRLTDLTVEVRNSHGTLVSGQEIQVWTVDYDKDTKYWQEIDVMTVEPADWKTDVTGRVRIPTFPEGNYLISTLAPDGGRVEIPFEARPGRANVALITLP